jgi:oligopeptide transport system substrate-binding protein
MIAIKHLMKLLIGSPAHRLTAALLLFFLAACSGGGSNPQAAVPTAAPVAIAPVAPPVVVADGGTLIMTLGARDPNTLDPALVGDTTSAFVVRQIFSGLVRLDNELAVQPDLAERWEVSDDGLVYTFALRRDARFSDGTALTANNVQYSLERAADPQLGQFLPARTYLTDIVGVREKLDGQADTISGIEVLDEYTLRITIDGPKRYFLAKLAHPTSFVVQQANVENDPQGWTENAVGSGPFVIERWEHDNLLLLARNTNFYREQARLSRVRMLMGAQASNALVLYEEGDIDLTSVPSYALARVQDENNPFSKQLVSVPQLSIYYIGMNVTIPPFDDPKVRQAFSLLIDRVRVAEISLAGSGEAARGILPPGMPAYNAKLPAPTSDIEQARQLLNESRYGGADQLPPIVAYGGGWTATLRDVAQEALGIEIEVRDYEDFGAYLAALDAGEFALYGTGWIADYPDPENFLDLLFRGGSGENHTGYASPVTDDLLNKAAVEQDTEARYALYQQAEAQILADAPLIPLYHDVEHMLIKPYVKGLVVTPMGMLDLSTVELVR